MIQRIRKPGNVTKIPPLHMVKREALLARARSLASRKDSSGREPPAAKALQTPSPAPERTRASPFTDSGALSAAKTLPRNLLASRHLRQDCNDQDEQGLRQPELPDPAPSVQDAANPGANATSGGGAPSVQTGGEVEAAGGDGTVVSGSVTGSSCWDYDAIADECIESFTTEKSQSHWLSDSQLKRMDPALTDSQLWGARFPRGNRAQDDSAGGAVAQLHLLEEEIRALIKEVDNDEVNGTDDDRIVLPLHLEVRALGTHLSVMRDRCNMLAGSLDQERRHVLAIEAQVDDLKLQLARLLHC